MKFEKYIKIINLLFKSDTTFNVFYDIIVYPLGRSNILVVFFFFELLFHLNCNKITLTGLIFIKFEKNIIDLL